MITKHQALHLHHGRTVYDKKGNPYRLVGECITYYKDKSWFQLVSRRNTPDGVDYIYITPKNAADFFLKAPK